MTPQNATHVAVLATRHRLAIVYTLKASGYRVTDSLEDAAIVVAEPEELAKIGHTTIPVVYIRDWVNPDLARIIDTVLEVFGPPVNTRRKPR